MDSLISNFLNIMIMQCASLSSHVQKVMHIADNPHARKVPCIAEEENAVFRRRLEAIVFKKEFSSGSKYPFRLVL